MQCAYCVYYTSAIVISFNPLWRHQRDFQRYCPFVRGNHTGVKVNSPHEGTVTRTFDVFVISLKKKNPVEQTLDWPQFRDAMTIIWRRRNALNSQYGGCWWPNAYLVPRHLEPSWRNRTVAYLSSCIFFYQNCPVVSATLRKWQRYPMQETSFLLFCDCIGVFL